MSNRKIISEMVMGILSKRGKRYPLVPSGFSEYIVFGIEKPDISDQNYRTGHLFKYLGARGMEMVVQHGITGERITVDSNEMMHMAIRHGMDFLCIRDSQLCSEGIGYNSKEVRTESIGIDRLCSLLDRLGYSMTIIDAQ